MRDPIGTTLLHGFASFAIVVVAPIAFWLLLLDGAFLLFGGTTPNWLRILFAAVGGVVLTAVWASLRLGRDAANPTNED
ncbi:MAG: hypothetical protein AAFZ05_08295 [Pseudomonadota bacterium]